MKNRKLLWIIVLAFLIVSVSVFFVSSTLSTPSVSGMSTEEQGIDVDNLSEKAALTLMIDENEFVYSVSPNKQRIEQFEMLPKNSLRDFLIVQREKLGDTALVLIKPFKKATYQSQVNILDEMMINDFKNYTLIPASTQDETIIELYKSGKKKQ